MTKRRFIAGAICPNCQALDRLVIEASEDESTLRRCVSCGFSEVMDTQPRVALPGRLEQRPRDSAKPSPVRILDPKQG